MNRWEPKNKNNSWLTQQVALLILYRLVQNMDREKLSQENPSFRFK